MRHHGKNRHRLKENPDEKVFADKWKEYNDSPHLTLEYMMGDGNFPASVSDRDEEIAATVVQWLGSPVGKWFLKECGFEKVDGGKRVTIKRR